MGAKILYLVLWSFPRVTLIFYSLALSCKRNTSLQLTNHARFVSKVFTWRWHFMILNVSLLFIIGVIFSFSLDKIIEDPLFITGADTTEKKFDRVSSSIKKKRTIFSLSWETVRSWETHWRSFKIFQSLWKCLRMKGFVSSRAVSLGLIFLNYGLQNLNTHRTKLSRTKKNFEENVPDQNWPNYRWHIQTLKASFSQTQQTSCCFIYRRALSGIHTAYGAWYGSDLK